MQILDHVETAFGQARIQDFQALADMGRDMAAIVQHQVDSAHLVDNGIQEIGIILRPDPHLAGLAIKPRTGRVDVDAEDLCLGPQVFAPHL